MICKRQKPCTCSFWSTYMWYQETTSEIYSIGGPEGLSCHLTETGTKQTDRQFTTKDLKSYEIFLFKKEYHHRYCECSHDDLLGVGDDTPGGGPAGKGGTHLFSHIWILLLLFSQPRFLVWRQRVFERTLTKCKVILSLCAFYLFLITVVHLLSTSVVSPTHTLHVLSTRDRHIRHHCHSRKNQKAAESKVEMCRASRRICWAPDFFPTNSELVLFPIWASLQPVGSDSPKEYGRGGGGVEEGGGVALLWLSGFFGIKAPWDATY